MWKNRDGDQRDHGGMAAEASFSADGRNGLEALSEGMIGGPRLRVRSIERTAIVRFDNAEFLVEESGVRAVSQQLHHLLEEGHTRLVVNLRGVRCLSIQVLRILAGLQGKVEQAGGSIQLCGVDPLLQELVRIAHLDREFDICGDEAEALGLLLCT
jgi:anti-anti-sigma factor